MNTRSRRGFEKNGPGYQQLNVALRRLELLFAFLRPGRQLRPKDQETPDSNSPAGGLGVLRRGARAVDANFFGCPCCASGESRRRQLRLPVHASAKVEGQGQGPHKLCKLTGWTLPIVYAKQASARADAPGKGVPAPGTRDRPLRCDYTRSYCTLPGPVETSSTAWVEINPTADHLVSLL